jgi:hypothetical protein
MGEPLYYIGFKGARKYIEHYESKGIFLIRIGV